MAVYLPQTLESLARLGVNLSIDGAHYQPQTLARLAAIARDSGTQLTISGSYLPNTLEELGQIAGNHLTVVVREEY